MTILQSFPGLISSFRSRNTIPLYLSIAITTILRIDTAAERSWPKDKLLHRTEPSSPWNNHRPGPSNTSVTTETGRVFFRRRVKQLPLATNKNVLGHVVWSRQMKSQMHVSTFLRAECGSVLSSWVFPTRFLSRSFVDLSLWSLLSGATWYR